MSQSNDVDLELAALEAELQVRSESRALPCPWRLLHALPDAEHHQQPPITQEEQMQATQPASQV